MNDEDQLPLESPEWMYCSEEAHELYRSLAAALNEIGFVRSFHQMALATYCESWERERELQKQIAHDGEVLENLEKGTKYLHPALNAQKMAQNEMARQAKVLGMEVSQLESLGVKKGAENSDNPNDPDSYI